MYIIIKLHKHVVYIHMNVCDFFRFFLNYKSVILIFYFQKDELHGAWALCFIFVKLASRNKQCNKSRYLTCIPIESRTKKWSCSSRLVAPGSHFIWEWSSIIHPPGPLHHVVQPLCQKKKWCGHIFFDNVKRGYTKNIDLKYFPNTNNYVYKTARQKHRWHNQTDTSQAFAKEVWLLAGSHHPWVASNTLSVSSIPGWWKKIDNSDKKSAKRREVACAALAPWHICLEWEKQKDFQRTEYYGC